MKRSYDPTNISNTSINDTGTQERRRLKAVVVTNKKRSVFVPNENSMIEERDDLSTSFDSTMSTESSASDDQCSKRVKAFHNFRNPLGTVGVQADFKAATPFSSSPFNFGMN